MNTFSPISSARLMTCDVSLRIVFEEVLKIFDCSILCGHRDQAEQERVFAEKLSKARWLESPHNFQPSFAVDVVPHPVDWEDTERMAYFAGHVKGIASRLGIDLVWGRDWDADTNLNDQNFNDYPHYEIAGWREQAAQRSQQEKNDGCPQR